MDYDLLSFSLLTICVIYFSLSTFSEEKTFAKFDFFHKSTLFAIFIVRVYKTLISQTAKCISIIKSIHTKEDSTSANKQITMKQFIFSAVFVAYVFVQAECCRKYFLNNILTINMAFRNITINDSLTLSTVWV